MRRPARLSLFLLPAALLYAGSFWEGTDYSAWTSAQVEEILNDSPWAREGSVHASTGGGAIGFPGGGSTTGGGVGLPGSAGRRTPGGMSIPNGGWGGGWLVSRYAQQQFDSGDKDVVVRWSSALPMRQAALRLLDGAPEAERRVAAEQLARQPDYYVISLTSLPAAGAWLAENPEKLRQACRLTRKGKPSIRAREIQITPHPGAPGVILYFPRDEDISLDDKTVQFEMTPGEVDVEAKFKLKDMLYRGRLEL
ncbi:MAG: hypothetical protein GC160_24455 [Acidobacteria bacterium]|nr:hypothetical protein [Acidobacteriota bacterium]